MGRFWTAANALSLTRLALVAPITRLVYEGGPPAPMFGLIGLAIATDWFDGRLARWSGQVSEWGKALDATADKAAAACVTLALLLRAPEAGPNLPAWFVALVVTRDALLAVGGLVQTRRIGRFTTSLWSGKVAVGLLALVVLAALADAPRLLGPLIWATTAVMAYSLVAYVRRFRLIWRLGPAVALDADGNVVEPGGPRRE
jgi:CDP-diacylglycerol--glycerol-3-phosphate 3-phosphatidyltransferase